MIISFEGNNAAPPFALAKDAASETKLDENIESSSTATKLVISGINGYIYDTDGLFLFANYVNTDRYSKLKIQFKFLSKLWGSHH